ncbi:FAD-linked oxidoreductase [Lophiostoma macrostomum CBS 122681]|uniref:Proline dehydrogenase n=1 Tax=Lophiostoma macrostomum CBS 122681 TaxID=1314788 RepID=A0A6A6SKM2_9PLEO|nr:FAD-linked oxidoreductase [Lophiostoma macrostomum CBS 122681]
MAASMFPELRRVSLQGLVLSNIGRRKHDLEFRGSSKQSVSKGVRTVHTTRKSSTTASNDVAFKSAPDVTPKTNSSRVSTQPPLSVMPMGMLLRSLMISTISSHRSLLSPSLRLLSFFVHSSSKYIFNVQRNPIVHGLLKTTIYNQFCTGESVQETKACVQRLKDLGFKGVILTYAKEIHYDHKSKKSHGMGTHADCDVKAAAVVTDADIEAWRLGNLKTLECIAEGDILAVKTTGAGQSVAEAFTTGSLPPKQMLDALFELGTICKQRGIQIIVDAESQHFQEGIDRTAIELMRKFNHDGKAIVYNTYQAYLKKTPSVIAEHLAEAARDGFTLGLKLVRGAYILSEDRSLIHDTIENTHNAYNSIVAGVLTRSFGGFGGEEHQKNPFPSVQLFVASHNRESALRARRLHIQRTKSGLPTVPIAFGQLQGMSDEVSFSLLQQKDEFGEAPEVYKCSTWGIMNECIAYLLRRAVENRDAVLRTSDELKALKLETKRRLRSLFSR